MSTCNGRRDMWPDPHLARDCVLEGGPAAIRVWPLVVVEEGAHAGRVEHPVAQLRARRVGYEMAHRRLGRLMAAKVEDGLGGMSPSLLARALADALDERRGAHFAREVRRESAEERGAKGRLVARVWQAHDAHLTCHVAPREDGCGGHATCGQGRSHEFESTVSVRHGGVRGAIRPG